jgi:hypothetical protein
MKIGEDFLKKVPPQKTCGASLHPSSKTFERKKI